MITISDPTRLAGRSRQATRPQTVHTAANPGFLTYRISVSSPYRQPTSTSPDATMRVTPTPIPTARPDGLPDTPPLTTSPTHLQQRTGLTGSSLQTRGDRGR